MLRSFRISGTLLMVNGLIVILLKGIIHPLELFGDLLLVETSLLFLLAGIVDFRSSVGFAQFWKLIGGSKEAFTLEVRKEAERRALIFVASGATLFIVMVFLALEF